MLSWISQNLGTILVALAVFGLICFVAIRMIRSRRQGKSACSSCGGACAHCAMAGRCHK